MEMQKWQALVDSEDANDEHPKDSQEAFEKQVYQAYQKGSDMYQSGDYFGAAQSWSQVLEIMPGDVHALWQRGVAKERMNDGDGAIADYTESLRLDSSASQAGVFFSRASAKSEKGDEDGAIADWSEVVRLEPSWLDAWCCRGTAKIGLGDPQGAAEDADEALRLDKDSVGAWGLRGAAKQMLEDHVGAAADCRRALKLDPSLTWVRATLERSCEAAPQETAEEILGEEPTPAPEKEVPTEPTPSVERLHELIQGVYERKNPEKLVELGTIFAKYAGKEMIMYRFICKKYGEEPVRFIESTDIKNALDDGAAIPKNSGGYPDGSSGDVGKAGGPEQEKEIVEDALEEVSNRERGNRLFKQGKLRKAIAAYKESFVAAEDGWILALSNQAICHLKLKEYEEAVSAANRCLEQDGVQEVPLKVHLTKFKALAELYKWVEAFDTLRKLRSRGELPAEVEAAALQEEQARRRQNAERVADELSSSDEEEEEVFAGDHAMVSRSLAQAVKLGVSADFTANLIFLVGIFGEKTDLFSEAFSEILPQALPSECEIRGVGRGEVCQALESQLPDLVVLCRPDLSGMLEDWAPVIEHLIRQQVLTVVTGFCDASLVENEDILRAVGCTVTSTTIGCFDGLAQHCDPHPHHHVLAFKGGTYLESFRDLPSLKQSLIDRGFNIPALTGLD